MTQEQLAERLDKGLAFIGAVEAPNIDRTISLDTICDIADSLEVPAYKFFTSMMIDFENGKKVIKMMLFR